jgi:hypothetical protein
MPYLNGDLVTDEEIDPKKHKFVGTFRKPFSEYKLNGIMVCDCGDMLHTREHSYSHWQMGHWDELMYEIINPHRPSPLPPHCF